MRANTEGKHEMGKRFAIVVAGVLAMIVSVVGWAAGSAGAQAPGCLPTSDRTPGKHGFPGLGIKARAAVYTDALQFAQFLFPQGVTGPHGDQFGPRPLGDPVLMKELDALNSEGFVSGTWQTRHTGYFGIGKTGKSHSYGVQGEAKTVQLGSPEQAQAELNRHVGAISRWGPGKRFTVAAIPGSQGLRSWARPREQGAFNTLSFTDGDYYYEIFRWDFALPGRQQLRHLARGTKSVTNAAINLYNRVHGAAVCP